MKKIIMPLIIFVMLLAPMSNAQAQDESQVVYFSLLATEGTVYVNAGDSIVLGHGWGACTKGLLKLYLSAYNNELRINDAFIVSVDGKDQNWKALTPFLPDWLPLCVAGNQKTGWGIRWEYPIGSLDPGEYQVTFHIWLDHPIIDGVDFDGDGRPDVYDGTLAQRSFTIVVLE